ncbi:MAG: hypothetical protein GF353_24905 [Candidatus Lokiarchaeota archaeon]|nr:hypothetical protein [Candidatus Lokiarchaeota archaeon]
MDHRKIESENIIDRYVMGRLSDEEQQEFEEHFFACDKCFEKVKMRSQLADIVKQADWEQVLAPSRKPMEAIFDWFREFNTPRTFAVVASILILLMIYPAWLGVFKVQHLEQKIHSLQTPTANIPIYFLEQTRGQAEPIEITYERGKSFIINFTLFDRKQQNSKINAAMLKDGDIVWHAENLTGQGPYEVFSISIPFAFREPGEFLLEVKEVDVDVVNRWEFGFEVVRH